MKPILTILIVLQVFFIESTLAQTNNGRIYRAPRTNNTPKPATTTDTNQPQNVENKSTENRGKNQAVIGNKGDNNEPIAEPESTTEVTDEPVESDTNEPTTAPAAPTRNTGSTSVTHGQVRTKPAESNAPASPTRNTGTTTVTRGQVRVKPTETNTPAAPTRNTGTTTVTRGQVRPKPTETNTPAAPTRNTGSTSVTKAPVPKPANNNKTAPQKGQKLQARVRAKVLKRDTGNSAGQFASAPTEEVPVVDEEGNATGDEQPLPPDPEIPDCIKGTISMHFKNMGANTIEIQVGKYCEFGCAAQTLTLRFGQETDIFVDVPDTERIEYRIYERDAKYNTYIGECLKKQIRAVECDAHTVAYFYE